jgi:predicted nuclease of restriction endonuclease-like RecB superfamily
MLPENLIYVDEVLDGVRPRWLAARDEVWVRALLAELDGHVGRSVEDAERTLDALTLPGAPPRAAAGMRAVLARLWKSTVVAAAPPTAVRRAVFDEAARPGISREQALARAAAALGISATAALASLYADRPGTRKVIAPEHVPSPREAIDLYHLALVQALLFRSEALVVRVREHVRAVVRFAKLKGLLCTYGVDAGGTKIALSGPLSLFRHTTKYGHALASFFPAVAATPGWSIEAQVVLRERRVRFAASAGDPIACAHALPRDADSMVERRFVRDVRRLGSPWTVERETAAVRAGGGVFFPDFTLRRGDETVYIEIVGYYTPEYLRSKLEALRQAGMRNLVVCIDEALACEDGEIAAAEVVRYHKRVDAVKVIEAAERVVKA